MEAWTCKPLRQRLSRAWRVLLEDPQAPSSGRRRQRRQRARVRARAGTHVRKGACGHAMRAGTHCTPSRHVPCGHVSCACMHTNFVTQGFSVKGCRAALYCCSVVVLCDAFTLHTPGHRSIALHTFQAPSMSPRIMRLHAHEFRYARFQCHQLWESVRICTFAHWVAPEHVGV